MPRVSLKDQRVLATGEGRGRSGPELRAGDAVRNTGGGVGWGGEERGGVGGKGG